MARHGALKYLIAGAALLDNSWERQHRLTFLLELHRARRFIGQLAFRFTDEQEFRAEDIEIARAFASQASLAFTGIALQLDGAQQVITTGHDDGLSYVQRATELAQFGLTEARRSAFSLQSALIEESGLIEALQKLVERSNIEGRLRCHFHWDGVPEELLAPSVQQDLLRIAQEAISNAVRTARHR
jgi:signal transduction histidine kinase